MDLAKRLMNNNYKLGYCADAVVYHLHNETWSQVMWRYEREAFALRLIMPEVHVSFWDFLRYTINAITIDSIMAVREKVFFRNFIEIIMFRTMQYWGNI